MFKEANFAHASYSYFYCGKDDDYMYCHGDFAGVSFLHSSSGSFEGTKKAYHDSDQCEEQKDISRLL